MNLARFNMPLELGIALGHASFGPLEHDWCAVTLADHESSRYISYLMGFDLPRHDGTVETLIPPVMARLLMRKNAIGRVTPRDVVEPFAAFSAELAQHRVLWAGELAWAMTLRIAQKFIPADR